MNHLIKIYIFICFCTPLWAQQGTEGIDGKYIILSAVQNGREKDMVGIGGGYLSFCTDANGKIYLANARPHWKLGGQNYGMAELLKHSFTEQNDQGPAKAIYEFKWHYTSTYNDLADSTTIRITKTYKKDRWVFTAEIEYLFVKDGYYFDDNYDEEKNPFRQLSFVEFVPDENGVLRPDTLIYNKVVYTGYFMPCKQNICTEEFDTSCRQQTILKAYTHRWIVADTGTGVFETPVVIANYKFSINYNENGDIMLYSTDRGMQYFQRTEKSSIGYTYEGYKYTTITAIDEFKDEYDFVFFSDFKSIIMMCRGVAWVYANEKFDMKKIPYRKLKKELDRRKWRQI